MSFDKLDPPMDEPSHSLPEALRWDARHREGMEDSSRDLMRMAADRVEALEQALVDVVGWENWQTPTWREIARAALPDHLEREAATAGVGDLPLIPMREDYDNRLDWHDAMVAWVRAVTAVDQSRDA